MKRARSSFFASQEPAVPRPEISRRDKKSKSDALAAAEAMYRRLSPSVRSDQLAVSECRSPRQHPVTSGPQQRAEVLREWLTPKLKVPAST
jgi:hypothetical protein